MIQHRCTRCKVDQGQFGIRHKAYLGGLFCESCLRELRGSIGVRPAILGFLDGIWQKIVGFVEWATAPFTRTHKVALRDKAAMVKVAYDAARMKAMHMPANPAIASPQMH